MHINRPFNPGLTDVGLSAADKCCRKLSEFSAKIFSKTPALSNPFLSAA